MRHSPCPESAQNQACKQKIPHDREMLIDILQSIMKALRTETSVKMSEIFENYTPLSIVKTALSYLPQALQ